MRIGLTVTFLALWGSAAIGVLLLHPDHGGSNSEAALIALGVIWFLCFLGCGGVELATQLRESKRRKGLIQFVSEYWMAWLDPSGLLDLDLHVDIHAERTSFTCAVRALVDGEIVNLEEPHIDHRLQDIRCYIQTKTIQPFPAAKLVTVYLTVKLDTGLANDSGARDIAVVIR